MNKDVTNAEFEHAISDQDNRNIIKSVCNQYRNILEEDVLNSCGLNGLWQCLKSHDDAYGNKFTTSLYKFVDWQCKGQVCAQIRGSHAELIDTVDTSPAILDKMIIHEYVEKLSLKHQAVIYGKFFENKNYAEIARDMGCSREYVRQMLNKALKLLRKSMCG
jgi:RNA polymerase sigma factor (sigma-70 family)